MVQQEFADLARKKKKDRGWLKDVIISV